MQKKDPVRMCLGCGIRKPKAELIRIVKNEEGDPAVDVLQKVNSRGAYVCCDKNCIQKALKKKSFERMLKIHMDTEKTQALLNMIGNENG